MNKKAQILLLFLWILAMLTLFAISVGQHVSLALKVSRYQVNKIKAASLAQAGVNLAIAVLEKDTNLYTSLNGAWADNPQQFGKIKLNDNENEFACVSHPSDENASGQPKFGMTDEESKLNINKASVHLLIALFEKYHISPFAEIAENILIWRGEKPDDNKIYESLGYPAEKKGAFTNISELKLVKGITDQDYLKIEKLITVYGGGKININTVSKEVLAIVCRGIARSMEVDQQEGESLAEEIISLRKEKGYFTAANDITAPGGTQGEILAELNNGSIIFKSNNFLIAVSGNAGRIKSTTEAVYDRERKKIIYWYQT